MADAASDEPVRVEADGVTVEKSYEPDDFPVPAIAFTIRSERDESVSVRLVDTVPDDVPTEDIGFHPKYGAEFWEVEGTTIVFTREFEPHEEFVTVYGLRGKDASEIERFLTEPELDSVDPIDGDSGDVVRDVLGDDGDDDGPATGMDIPKSPTADDEAEGDAEDEETTDLDLDLPEPGDDVVDEAETVDESDDEEADEGGATATGPSGAPGAAATTVPEGSLATALAEEIRAGEVDDDDMEELRDALGVTADDSTNARIEHLQNTVADLEAYTGALEEFLDEEGDAQSLIEEVRDDFESAGDRIDDIEADLEDLWAEVDQDFDEELADIREDVETFESDLETIESDLEAATEERLDALEDDLDELEAELADVAEMRDRLASALGGLGGSSSGNPGGTDSGSDDDDDGDS